MQSGQVLIVDDDPAVRKALSRILEGEEYDIREAGDCKEALAAFRPDPPDVTVLDHLLPDGDALELLPRLQEIDPATLVIVLTGHGSIDLAVQALKEGAEHFLTKPPDVETVRTLVRRLVERRRLQRRLSAREASGSVSDGLDPFLGRSAAIRSLADRARKVADAETTVLIRGETGSGKGVLARWLHRHGPRSEEPLVDVNCAMLGGELLESNLFGHARGAFTGAVDQKRGLLEVAHRGTVFLDEIGDLDLQVQGKLLKVLEEQRLRRVGGTTDRTVDVRVIAATHRDLKEMVAAEKFRKDLYFRIHTIPIGIPPLRDRPEDIEPLAEHLLVHIGHDLGNPKLRLSPAALAQLQGYGWPGNIRELRNVLERAAILASGDVLRPPDLHFEFLLPDASGESPDLWSLEEMERRHIERALHTFGGKVSVASEHLDVPRSTLYQKIKRYGIDLSEF